MFTSSGWMVARIVAVSILLIAGITANAWCRDLFVSTTGNDSVSYANNSISAPWATVLKAHQEARAGDTVYFRAGTYPVNSISTGSYGFHGTAVSPVTFTRYESENVIWRSTSTNVTIRVGKNHHHYQYLNCVHEPSGSMTGDRGFFQSGYETTSDGLWIKYCTFTMNSRGDNYGSIHLKNNEGCTNVEISHNKIVHTGTSGSTNSSGIICFGINTFKINNNEISGPPMGIYLKHANSSVASEVDGEVRNNFVKSTTRRALFCNFNHLLIENNIIHYDNTGCTEGEVHFNESNGGPGGDYNTIRNNTFMTAVWFMEDSGGAIHNVFEGNIIAGSGNLWNNHPYASIADYTTSDYNLFISGPCIKKNGTSYGLSTWKSSIRQDSHSLSGSPSFVGGPAPSPIAGYRLAEGSIGKGVGINGADMGANVSMVGTGGVDIPGGETGPQAPSGLNVLRQQ